MTSSEKPRILCLNDQETALMLRKLVLESQGYDVITATHAQDAIAIVSTQRLDLVIADHLLRDTIGTDVAGEIKRLRPSLPIILLSGVMEPPENMQDVDAFVSKGEGREALLKMIVRFVKPQQER